MKFSRYVLFWPGTLAAIVFIVTITITVYITISQQEATIAAEKERLNDELAHTKDRFRNILYSDITVANSMAIIYREYGFRNNFDSIAKELISKSEYAQALQLTVDGVVTHVYPIDGYENVIGKSICGDSVRDKEYNLAEEKNEILFFGPREVRAGGTGILGKVPVLIDDTLKALVVVLSRMDLIQKVMNTGHADNGYAYELLKHEAGSDTTHYLLSTALPSAQSSVASAQIPEGDWELRVSFAEGYQPPGLPPLTMTVGFVLALAGFASVFRISNRNRHLGEIVDVRTHELRERIKELSTIYTMGTILRDEHLEISELLQQIVEVIPSGWQYPEVCEANITYDEKSYTSHDYTESKWKQTAPFCTYDGKEGMVEVVYTEQRPIEAEGVFLKEERSLINTLAELLQSYLNKRLQHESLARSEARFRVGFENASIGMALVSMDGKWIAVNRALCDMVGYTESELLGKNFADITHPDDLDADFAFIQKVNDGKAEHHRKEKRYIHKNGTIVWVNLNVGLVRDNGRPSYFVAQIENITEKLEADLKFRNLVEKSMVGVYIIQNGRFAYVNPHIMDQSGYSEMELKHMRVEEFVHPDDAALVTKQIQARMRGQIEGLRYEVRAFRKGGDMIWIEMFGNTTLYQGKPAIIGTMVNITDKKQAFNELVKSEANLKSIFDNTQVGYLLLDTRFSIISVNNFFLEMYEKLTGMRVETGGHMPDYFLPHRKEFLIHSFSQVLETGAPVNFESLYPDVGEGYYYDSTISPIYDGNRIIGLCFAAIDISNRKKAEIATERLSEDRQRIVEDLIRRNRDLEQFSYIVSHNVRGPVATILGLSGIANNTTYKSEVRATATDGILKSALKLDSVLLDLNDILALRKNTSECKTKVDLGEITDTALQMASDQAEKKELKLLCDYTAAATVYGIKSYIQNIFYNMISNAIKYAKPNADAELSIWTEVNETEIVLHFKDKGLGIDLEKHGEYMFGLYKRFHFSADGKGMGLYMVKTQVEALDGTISVQSKPGEGAHFIIVFQKTMRALKPIQQIVNTTFSGN